MGCVEHCVCVRVCACVCARGRDRDIERGRLSSAGTLRTALGAARDPAEPSRGADLIMLQGLGLKGWGVG